MAHKSGAPLHQEGAHHALAAASTLSSSSMLDSEEDITKPAAKGSLSSGAGGKQDEGSPVSVLDAMPSEVLLVKANDPMHKGKRLTYQALLSHARAGVLSVHVPVHAQRCVQEVGRAEPRPCSMCLSFSLVTWP